MHRTIKAFNFTENILQNIKTPWTFWFKIFCTEIKLIKENALIKKQTKQHGLTRSLVKAENCFLKAAIEHKKRFFSFLICSTNRNMNLLNMSKCAQRQKRSSLSNNYSVPMCLAISLLIACASSLSRGKWFLWPFLRFIWTLYTWSHK